MNRNRIILVAAFAAALAAYFIFGLERYLSLDHFRERQSDIEDFVAAHPVSSASAYFLTYVVMAALSLPGAALMTLVAGALFGVIKGTVIVSFASSIGATLAFLAARFLMRDWVQGRFAARLEAINANVRKDGAFYLFALRLVPAFPFFVINLAMGLTPMRARVFYGVSQLGMLPGTVLYVYAGTQLGQFEITWQLLLALGLLGAFPLVARKMLDAFKARRAFKGWKPPRRYERNLVVIGAGSAGLVSAYIASAVKARVTLIEKHRMGGDCLNTGCVPSKALIRSAKFVHGLRRAAEYGVRPIAPEFDFAQIMERVQRVIRTVEPHDSVERFTNLGVECLPGNARITTPWSVEIESPEGAKRTITTRSIVIAAGARPFVPPIPGLSEARPLTSDSASGRCARCPTDWSSWVAGRSEASLRSVSRGSALR